MTVIRPVDISREILFVLTVLQEPLLAVVFTPDLVLTEPQSEQTTGGLASTVHPPGEADLLILRPASQVDNPRPGPCRVEAESEESCAEEHGEVGP